MLQQHQNFSTVLLLFYMVMISTFRIINGEVYTALAEMEELLETEAVLIANLEGFIDVQQKKLDYLKK